jgi:hypothetical protein
MKKSAKQLGNLTNHDLDKVADVISGLLDKGLAPMSTKKDLRDEISGVETRLKKYIHEGVETIMVELDRVEDMLVEKQEVEKLKIWAVKVSEKVGIKL